MQWWRGSDLEAPLEGKEWKQSFRLILYGVYFVFTAPPAHNALHLLPPLCSRALEMSEVTLVTMDYVRAHPIRDQG